MPVLFPYRALLLGVLLLLSVPAAQAQTPAEPPAKPVRAGLDDSTYLRHDRERRHLLDAITRNQPLSWIAAGGEFSPCHQTAANAPEREPRYLFSAYLTTSFVVVSQPRFAFTVEPAFGLRMRRDGPARGSYPIRTPSYHAVGSLYLLTRLRTTPGEEVTPGCPAPPEADELRYQYLRLNFRHHSNGQEGAALIPGPVGQNGRQPNQLHGNFANNAVEASYVLGARTTGGAWSVAPYGSYGLPASADPTQDGRYLFHRVGVRLTREVFSTWRRVLGKAAQTTDASSAELARRNKSRFYTELNVSLGLSRLDSLSTEERRFERRRLNAEATAVYIPRFMSQTGLFVTVGYYGEDPCNIWYLHRYPFVRVGIATAAFRNVTQLLR